MDILLPVLVITRVEEKFGSAEQDALQGSEFLVLRRQDMRADQEDSVQEKKGKRSYGLLRIAVYLHKLILVDDGKTTVDVYKVRFYELVAEAFRWQLQRFWWNLG